MGSFWSSEAVLALGLVLAAAAFAYSPVRPPFCASKPRRLAAPAAHGASGSAGSVEEGAPAPSEVRLVAQWTATEAAAEL